MFSSNVPSFQLMENLTVKASLLGAFGLQKQLESGLRAEGINVEGSRQLWEACCLGNSSEVSNSQAAVGAILIGGALTHLSHHPLF